MAFTREHKNVQLLIVVFKTTITTQCYLLFSINPIVATSYCDFGLNIYFQLMCIISIFNRYIIKNLYLYIIVDVDFMHISTYRLQVIITVFQFVRMLFTCYGYKNNGRYVHRSRLHNILYNYRITARVTHANDLILVPALI